MLFKRLLAPSLLCFTLIASSSFAGPVGVFHPGLRQTLLRAGTEGKVRLNGVALGREALDTIELEPMQVWATDAKIIVFGASGEETLLPIPNIRYFKGHVAGSDESAVFFSMSPDGSIRGMVLIGDRRWTIGTGERKTRGRSDRIEATAARSYLDAPVLVTEIDAIDELTEPNESGTEWECEAASVRLRVPSQIRKAVDHALEPKPDAGNVSGATYQLRLAFETDNEFCTAFSNNTTTLTTYIGDLVGKASTVYSRDVKATLIVGETHLRTGGAGTDPWTATTVTNGLNEFSTYWHNNYGGGHPQNPDVNFGDGLGTAGAGTTVPRSSAIFLSGKLLNGGFAWIDQLCETDFYCGNTGVYCGSSVYAGRYAGGYAFNTSLNSVTTTVPDPTATVNGVEFGLPTGTNYWMLLEVLHELGHNVASPHSSCVELTPAEQVTYGVARGFVDLCLSGESYDSVPCHSGALSAPAEKGTVMSYCHTFTAPDGFRQSRYLLGKAGEPSEKMLPIFKNGHSGTSNPLGLEGSTPTATMTTQSEPVACSAERTSSVPSCSGCTYSWQITGGSITSSNTINAITYTPTETSVTLTVTILSSRGCGITVSKTISTLCVAVLPPTNVGAAAQDASTVTISWTASIGASSYNVYRSTDNVTFTLAGNTASTSFNDGSRSANTAYMYKVRAFSGGESADSSKDFATTVAFTDPTISTGSTVVKAAHIAELRSGVNALRTLNGGQSAFSFTDATLDSTILVKAVHYTELQTQLNTVRTALGFPTISFTETPSANTPIEKLHVDEMRPGIQ